MKLTLPDLERLEPDIARQAHAAGRAVQPMKRVIDCSEAGGDGRLAPVPPGRGRRSALERDLGRSRFDA